MLPSLTDLGTERHGTRPGVSGGCHLSAIGHRPDRGERGEPPRLAVWRCRCGWFIHTCITSIVALSSPRSWRSAQQMCSALPGRLSKCCIVLDQTKPTFGIGQRSSSDSSLSVVVHRATPRPAPHRPCSAIPRRIYSIRGEVLFGIVYRVPYMLYVYIRYLVYLGR